MTKTKQLPHHASDWSGYSMDELRYMRAYTAARIEINKDRIMTRIHEVSKAGKKGMTPTGMAGRILGAFSYLDMAIIAWKVGSKALRLVRTLKR
ncbi:MAG: hypothetical protein NC039_01040 [Muribaculaceae bacterium]|nr:hypothetical protein [Muribaculaceae bacterium]